MRIALGVLLLTVVAVPAFAEEEYPLRGFAPPQQVGGFVQVPGLPMPPIPVESVRTSITIWEKVIAGLRFLGETPALARGIGFLATLHAGVKETEKAEHLFDEAERILKKTGPPGLDLAWVNNNRGLAQLGDERFTEGLRSFRRALTILQPDREEFLEPRMVVLTNVATGYSLLGDGEQAESAYLRVLDAMHRMGIEGSLRHQMVRSNLAMLYGSMGDFESARRLIEKLLTERGTRGIRFALLNNLGYALSALKEFPQAEQRLMEAQALSREGSEERLLVLMNLTAMHSWAGRFEQADECARKGLVLARQLHGENSRAEAAVMVALAATLMSRGELVETDRLLVKAAAILSQQPGDQETVISINKELALVAHNRGQKARAADLSRKTLDLSKKYLERMLAYGSEAQRLAYRENAHPYDLLANTGDAELLADAVLAMKGVVLDSLLAERALARKGDSQADRNHLDRIHELKLAIMEKIGRGRSDTENLARELRKEEAALTKGVRPRVRQSPVRVDVAGVQTALKADQVLVEIIGYLRYADGGQLIPAYGGVIIPRDGRPSWVPLGDAANVDGLIRDLVRRFGGGRGNTPLDGPADVNALLRDLNRRLWEPLAKALPSTAHEVVLSPDGATSILPWAALLDEKDRFLAERWCLTQVNTGRDLLRKAEPSSDKTLLALGDGGGDLPFSRAEVKEVAESARQHGWQATILVGKEASESVLFENPRPRILHLATHGGTLGVRQGDELGSRLSTNPMYRGYLLLGGGKETLKAWRGGTALPFFRDGILTAEEAGGLDLTGTWLTVLSACDTGAGDAREGEGVLGLRRGFALAGSDNLIFSLWPVEDEATAEFMKAFYARLFAEGDPDRAFQETQLAELLRWKQQDLASAVHRAGGFVFTR